MPVDDIFSDDTEENWPDEPEQPDESLGLEAPTVPDYSDRDVPMEVQRTFWTAVALLNVAVGGVSVGLMLIAFQGRWTFGGALLVVGLVAGLRTWRIYRNRRKD